MTNHPPVRLRPGERVTIPAPGRTITLRLAGWHLTINLRRGI